MEDSKLADYHDKVAASAPRGGRGGLGALGELRAASAGASTSSGSGLYSYFVRAGEAPAGASAESKRMVFEASGDASSKRSRGASSADAASRAVTEGVFDWHPAIRAAVEAAARLQVAAGAGPAELNVPVKLVRKAVCSAAKRAETEALKAAGRKGKEAKASRGSKRSRQEAFQVALDGMAREDALVTIAGEVGLTGDDLAAVLGVELASVLEPVAPASSSSDAAATATAAVSADAEAARDTPTARPAKKDRKAKTEKKAKKASKKAR